MLGFIYIMSNPAHSGLLKIGQTGKDPEERRKELGSTGVVQDFVLEYRALSEDYESLEREIHRALANVRTNPKKEFFNISVPEAVNKIREISGNRIESDKVFYVSPEELQRIKDEKQKILAKIEAKIEKRKKEREQIAEKERKQRFKESLQKLDAISIQKKTEEIEKLKIEKEKLRIEREREKERERERLEHYNRVYKPPKNILLFPLWIILFPWNWHTYLEKYGDLPFWKGYLSFLFLGIYMLIMLILFMVVLGFEI